MTEEEKQFNQWFDEYADGVKVFEEADMKQAYLQGRAELEKENAELKEKYAKNITDCDICNTYCNSQLTKAKELLERLLITSCNSEVLNLLPNCSEVLRVRVETEQFLKETK